MAPKNRTTFGCALLLSAMFFPFVALAQQGKEPDFSEIYFSEKNRRYHDMAERTSLRAQWNGKNTRKSIAPLLNNKDFQTALELSEEQMQQLDFMTSKHGSMGHWYRAKAKDDPELQARLDEMRAIQEGDHHLEKATPEQLRRYAEIQEEITYYYHEESHNDFEKILTPEQLRSVHEMEIALLPELGIMNPGMFEALDLTEEQKEKLETVKEELKKDFEDLIEASLKVQNEIKDILHEAIKGSEDTGSYEGFTKAMNKAAQDGKVREKVEQIRLKYMERGRQLMSRLKIKMLDVLTVEQLDRMQKLIDHPHDFLAKFLKQIRSRRELAEKAGQQPQGLDSWRPGDPIPEEYLKERKARQFPTKEAHSMGTQ